MDPEKQHERLQAYGNGNLLADCEECGAPIPVELTRCTDCDWIIKGRNA
jgi:hypothetical protein